MSSDPVPKMRELLDIAVQFIRVMPLTAYAIWVNDEWVWMTNIAFAEKLETISRVKDEYVVVRREEYEALKNIAEGRVEKALEKLFDDAEEGKAMSDYENAINSINEASERALDQMKGTNEYVRGEGKAPCDHPNKYLSFKMVGVVHYCPDCKKTLIMDYVTVPREEYEELKEKAGKFDLLCKKEFWEGK